MISVIIPTYGKPALLENAIKSVIRQTEEDWELIIVDDNDPSTEARRQTEALVKEYVNKDRRISYYQHFKNRNGAVARNTGIRYAKGNYIAFLDSDDEYIEDRLKRCRASLEGCHDPHFGGVYTGCEFRKNGKCFHREQNIKAGNYLVDTLACTFKFCSGSNLFIKADIVHELNGFDENFIRHQDYEFLVRFFQKYQILAIPDILLIKNNENFNVPNLRKMEEVKKLYLKKYDDIIKNLTEKEKNYIYFSHCIALAEAAAKSGLKEDARSYYKKAHQYGKLPLRVSLRRMVFFLLSMKKGK